MLPHGSVVMLPDGKMFGRVGHRGGVIEKMSGISAVGDDLLYWHEGGRSSMWGSSLCGIDSCSAPARRTGCGRRR